MLTTFSKADIKAMDSMTKVGLLATVNREGLPHLTLISSLQANTPQQLIWGQFVEGLSKEYIRENPQVGFLVMTLDKQLWRGKATFTHMAQQGPEFEMYNNTPMFRYNAYFGIHTVYYMDMIEHWGQQALPMGVVVLAAIQTTIARTLASRRKAKPVLGNVVCGQSLTPWTQTLMNKLDNLKFLAYVDADGYPVIIPVIQAQAASNERIIFATGAYKHELEAIPPNTSTAVLGMSLDMEDVLMRGKFQGIQRTGGIRWGSIQVDWVYNPMPPKPQQIYPQVALEPITTSQSTSHPAHYDV
jgi:hypothetical protein